MTECFLGIDVSKGYADFVLIDDSERMLVKPFRLDDTAEGYARLRAVIDAQYQRHPDLVLYAAVESTGGLENNWLYQLRSIGSRLPVHSARINPKGVAQYIKADLTRTITDGVSALAIARYQVAHRRTIRYDEADMPLEQLRPAWTMYCLLKKQRQQILGNLHPLLYTANPGIMQYCRRGIPKWLCSVVERYPTARKLARARVAVLSRIPYVSMQKAEALVNLAARESGSRCDQSTEATISLLIAQLRHLDKQLDAAEKILVSGAGGDPRVELVASVAGIGIISSIGLMMNIPGVTMVENSGQLAAYWGLHPVFKESGDGQTVSRMSKAGRVQPRSILYMATISGIVHNPVIRALYKRRVRNGMKPLAAIGVCMHKLARIIFGILKSGVPFDPSIDEKNCAKQVWVDASSAKARQKQSLRRLQKEDPVAPISRKEWKKRTAPVEPQNAKGVEYEVIDRNAVLT